MISPRFALFVLAGGLAACANFGSRIFLSEFLEYVPAIVVAYCIGMSTAFVLNRLFVFTAPKDGLRHQVLWFVAVNLAAVAQTVVISVLLSRWIFPLIGMHYHPETVAHGIGVIVPVFSSYFGHKWLTFRTEHPQ